MRWFQGLLPMRIGAAEHDGPTTDVWTKLKNECHRSISREEMLRVLCAEEKRMTASLALIVMFFVVDLEILMDKPQSASTRSHGA